MIEILSMYRNIYFYNYLLYIYKYKKYTIFIRKFSLGMILILLYYTIYLKKHF